MHYDAVIIGAGPAGEVATGALAGAGLEVALVERELVGGECGYWGCIPSKTLLRPPEVQGESRRTAGVSTPELDWERIAEYRNWMIRNLDDTGAVEGYRKRGVSVYKGRARLAGKGRVEVGDDVLSATHVIVATGSETRVPPIPGLREAGYWTNREATTFNAIPASVAFIGGGPIGVELGQMFARLGAEVTIVQGADRLVDREGPEVGRLIAEELKADGVALRLGRQATSVSLRDGRRVVELDDGTSIAAEVLVVAAGRRPNVRELGLETVGIDAGDRGIAVDERCRAAEGVWAIGDVTGVALFTHVGKYQARIATANILGEDAVANYQAIPRVVFSDPEIAAVGLTAQQARDRGLDVDEVVIDLPQAIARPYTYETDPRGTLGLVADREHDVLVGAWAVAPLAGEWIHQAVLAIRAQVPLSVLRDTIAQFPTFSEAYVSALQRLPKGSS